MTDPRLGSGGYRDGDQWHGSGVPAPRAYQSGASYSGSNHGDVDDMPHAGWRSDLDDGDAPRVLTPEEQAAEAERERIRKAEEEAAAERLRNSYQDAAEVSGRPIAEMGYWLALAVTAGADVAAFHAIVSLVMSTSSDWIVWLMVAGFTACSLTLAHFAGRLARDAAARHGTATRAKVMMMAVPWAALGLIAFVVRLMAAFDSATSVGGTTVSGGLSEQARDVAASLMFLALYVASGAVAGFGVYLTRNPVRVGYRRALRAYHGAVRRLAKSQPPYERAIQVRRLHARSRFREENNYKAAKAQRLAFADELKRYAALLIASHLQDPSVTESMTLPDRVPLTLPPQSDPGGTGPEETDGDLARSPALPGDGRFGAHRVEPAGVHAASSEGYGPRGYDPRGYDPRGYDRGGYGPDDYSDHRRPPAEGSSDGSGGALGLGPGTGQPATRTGPH